MIQSLFFIVFIFIINKTIAQRIDSNDFGRFVPLTSFVDINNNTVQIGDTSTVQVIYLFFKNCPYCKDLSEVLDSLKNSTQKNVQWIAISSRDTKEDLMKYINLPKMPVIYSPSKFKPKKNQWGNHLFIKQTFNTTAYPCVLIIKKGKIIFKQTGFKKGVTDHLLKQQLTSL